jgi:hypothetical protein
VAVQFCFASGIGLQDDGEVDATSTRWHKAFGNIGCGVRNTSGLLAAQPGRVLDIDWSADARAEGVDGIFGVHGDRQHLHPYHHLHLHRYHQEVPVHMYL